MEKIEKAVVISDLHLGIEDSLFFHRNQQRFKNVMDWLAAELKRCDRVDELILLGDFLDLSLAPLDVLYDNAREFFKKLSGSANIKNIYFIPGNHDHHVWIELVEQDVVMNRIKSNLPLPSDTGRDTDREAPGKKYIDCFVDRKYPDDSQEVILRYLWPSDKACPKIYMKYPNHARRLGDQYYFFTHGHFLDDWFTPALNLIKANSLEELEAFNIVWVEAFDYYLGHSGGLSEKVRTMVRLFHGGQKKELNEEIDKVLEVLKERTGVGNTAKWLIKRIINYVIRKKKDTEVLIHVSAMRGKGYSKKLEAKIVWYIKDFVLGRYAAGRFGFSKSIAHPFTFVFGHTHAPFKPDEKGNRYREIEIGHEKYKVYNTGGWTIPGEGISGRAGLLVIDSYGCEWRPYS